MPLIGYGQGGYGEGGYGGSFAVVLSGAGPILQDSTGAFWAFGVADDGTPGTTAFINIPLAHQLEPILFTPSTGQIWQIVVDISGNPSTIKFKPPTIRLPVPYLPVVSPGGFFYNLTINPDGSFRTTSTSFRFPIIVPYIPNVSMSQWNDSLGILCPNCGNSTVTVSTDLSCWCYSCSTFVPPEDTTIIVVLEE